MRTVMHATVAILVLCAAPLCRAQQPSTDALEVQRLAIRSALAEAGANGQRFRIVISSEFASTDGAPSSPSRTARSAPESAMLAREFDARVRSSRDVIQCAPRGCVLRDADLLISLSRPNVFGDSGTVSVTVQRVSRRRLAYVTNRLILKRLSGIWQIASTEQLGIS
jgi:hypothetical protein